MKKQFKIGKKTEQLTQHPRPAWGQDWRRGGRQAQGGRHSDKTRAGTQRRRQPGRQAQRQRKLSTSVIDCCLSRQWAAGETLKKKSSLIFNLAMGRQVLTSGQSPDFGHITNIAWRHDDSKQPVLITSLNKPKGDLFASTFANWNILAVIPCHCLHTFRCACSTRSQFLPSKINTGARFCNSLYVDDGLHVEASPAKRNEQPEVVNSMGIIARILQSRPLQHWYNFTSCKPTASV